MLYLGLFLHITLRQAQGERGDYKTCSSWVDAIGQTGGHIFLKLMALRVGSWFKSNAANLAG